jgi:RNA polymerase sigma-70 factor (ECF subfamily)
MNPLDSTLEELLRRMARQDQDAMAEFHAITKSMLRACIRRLVRDPWNAEEVLQDTYRCIWMNAGVYRPDRGAPSAWIHMIARSRALDALRRSRGECPQSLDDRHELASFRKMEPVQPFGSIHGLVQQLPAPHRELLRLAFYEGYSHAEIADETGVPLGTVKTRIRVALKQLRGNLVAA